MYIFIRHADKQYTNKQGKQHNHLYKFDPDITDQGVENTSVISRMLEDKFGPIYSITSSPFLRCRRTAQIISKTLGIDRVSIDPMLSSYLGHQKIINKKKDFHPETLSFDIKIDTHIDSFKQRVFDHMNNLPITGKVNIIVTHDYNMHILDGKNIFGPLDYYIVQENMMKIDRMIEMYLPKFSNDEIISVNEWIQSNEGMMKDNIVFDFYMDEIKDHIPYLTKLTSDKCDECILTSGLFCFVGQLLLYITQYGLWNKNVLADITDFTLLYLYADYYMDNVMKDDINLNMMKEMILDPYKHSSIPGLDNMVLCYRGIIERHTDKEDICKERMINVFMCEVEGIMYQNNPNLDENEYMKIACKKGGATTIAIQSMFNRSKEYDIQIHNLGAIIQLIDDMMDVEVDISNNINTIATHIMNKDSVMDRLWLETAERIDRIEEPFLLFKVCMLEGLLYVLNIEDYFSNNLRSKFSQYIHINYSKGSHMMDIISSSLKVRI